MSIYPIEEIQVATGEKAMSIKYNKLCANAVNSEDDIHPQYNKQDFSSNNIVLTRHHSYGDTYAYVKRRFFDSLDWYEKPEQTLSTTYSSDNVASYEANAISLCTIKKTGLIADTISASVLIKQERHDFPNDATFKWVVDTINQDTGIVTNISTGDSITLPNDSAYNKYSLSDVDISSISINDILRVGIRVTLSSYNNLVQFAGQYQRVYTSMLQFTA